MPIRRVNTSYYEYHAVLSVSKEDGSREDKQYKFDTDILYNKFHFWNRKRLCGKCQKKLFEMARRDSQIVDCKLLEEKFILIHRFIYEVEK